jgi:hypothetical protein
MAEVAIENPAFGCKASKLALHQLHINGVSGKSDGLVAQSCVRHSFGQ